MLFVCVGLFYLSASSRTPRNHWFRAHFRTACAKKRCKGTHFCPNSHGRVHVFFDYLWKFNNSAPSNHLYLSISARNEAFAPVARPPNSAPPMPPRREVIAGSAKPRPSVGKPLQALQSRDRAPGSHCSHCRASPPRRDAITSSAQPRSRLRLHSQNKAPQTDIFDPIAPQKQANRKISTQNGTTIRGKSVSLRRCSPAPMPVSQTGAGWDRTYW